MSDTSDCAAVLAFLSADHSWHTKYQISDVLGISTRAVEEAVEHLRAVDAEPIISGGNGYRYTRSADKVRACRVAQFDDRIRAMFRTRRGLIRAEMKLRRVPAGQKTLFAEAAK